MLLISMRISSKFIISSILYSFYILYLIPQCSFLLTLPWKWTKFRQPNFRFIVKWQIGSVICRKAVKSSFLSAKLDYSFFIFFETSYNGNGQYNGIDCLLLFHSIRSKWVQLFHFWTYRNSPSDLMKKLSNVRNKVIYELLDSVKKNLHLCLYFLPWNTRNSLRSLPTINALSNSIYLFPPTNLSK